MTEMTEKELTVLARLGFSPLDDEDEKETWGHVTEDSLPSEYHSALHSLVEKGFAKRLEIFVITDTGQKIWMEQ